eukprot:14337928-Heterocapsa_arctica.AAC.1
MALRASGGERSRSAPAGRLSACTGRLALFEEKRTLRGTSPIGGPQPTTRTSISSLGWRNRTSYA